MIVKDLVLVAVPDPSGSWDGPPVGSRVRLRGTGGTPNRAEAIRWSLARISERPAYAQLRERTREIERLKSEF